MTRSLHDAPPGAHEAVVLPRPDPAAVEFLQPEARPLLRAVGIDKAYRRGVWPARRQTRVLCGADLPDLAGKTALELSEVAGDGTCCTTNATDAMSIDVPADVTAEMRMTTKAAACC